MVKRHVTNGALTNGDSTFFVGILSFMNSASRHRTSQGAWIFRKPIPGILLWNATKFWTYNIQSTSNNTYLNRTLRSVEQASCPSVRFIFLLSGRDRFPFRKNPQHPFQHKHVIIAAYGIFLSLQLVQLCKTTHALPDSLCTLQLGTLTCLDTVIHKNQFKLADWLCTSQRFTMLFGKCLLTGSMGMQD